MENTQEIQETAAPEVTVPQVDISAEKQQEYIPASAVCAELDTLVPKAMAYEQKRWNQGLALKINVDDFVMDRLHYTDYAEFCKAFAKEQVDAIATAIWNFENTGYGMILADQTGVGKGRVAAGLMRYGVLHLRKKSIFFSEKKHLITDIYRDLVDIGFDAGVPSHLLKKGEKIMAKDYSDDEILAMIQSDITANDDLRIDYDFEEDFALNSLFDESNSEMLAEIVEQYKQFLLEKGEESFFYEGNPEYKKQVSAAVKAGKYMVKPYLPFGGYKIKDAYGNILYEMDAKEAKRAEKRGIIPDEYKVICLPYSQISRPRDKHGALTPKMKLIHKYAMDGLIILDESHNASGSSSATGKQSNTAEQISTILDNCKYAMYVSATYAKRPNNMYLYAMKTSIKEANISPSQLITAFEKGGLPLQEATSAELVRIGQLLRREKKIQGVTEYYYESEESEIGLNQINKLNRVAELFKQVNDFSGKVQGYFAAIKKQMQPEEKWKYVFSGKTERFSFLLFNFFILGLKVRQTYEEAIKQMRGGKKVVIAIANTLESAFDNMKKDFEQDVPFEMGDVLKNDFSLYCAYLLDYTLRWTLKEKVIDENGKETDEVKRTTIYIKKAKDEISKVIWQELQSEYRQILANILANEVAVPISPIDVIKDHINKEGFVIEEITGRKKQLVFSDGDYSKGVISKRSVRNTPEIIRDFNENAIDCLIINQSGASGVSMHSKPNAVATIVYPPTKNAAGEWVENFPKTLKNKKEVKQRCMVITQMELDINKEVQKLGRINRTGQVYSPMFKYVISVIPSESRLTALNEKKLRSLSANVSSNQTQQSHLFTADDFFGGMAVEPFNVTMEDMNQRNRASHPNDIYEYTKTLYFEAFNFQRDFYTTFSKRLNAHIADLKQKGLYVGAMAIKDYSAKIKQTYPFIIGNNESYSSFGRHAFVELADCVVFEEKLLEYDVQNQIRTYSNAKDSTEDKLFGSIDEMCKYWDKRNKEYLDVHIKSYDAEVKFEDGQISQYEKDIEELNKQSERFVGLASAMEITEQIKSTKDSMKTKSGEVLAFMEEGDMEKMNVAALEVQTIKANIVALEKQFSDNPDFAWLLENKSGQNRIIRDIERKKKDIAYSEKQKLSLLKTLNEQKEIISVVMGYMRSIGNIYDFTELDETEVSVKDEEGGYAKDEDGLYVTEYTYNTISDKKVVLCAVRYTGDFNQSYTFGRWEMKFADVTKNIEKSMNPSNGIFNEEDSKSGRKHKLVLKDTGTNFKNNWNDYIATVNTGRTVEKMFVTGSLLKAFSILNGTGLGGGIIKYNTEDNKVKIGIVLNEESTKTMAKMFNEFSSEPYDLYFELIKKNYVHFILTPFTEEVNDHLGGYRMNRLKEGGFLNQINLSGAATMFLKTMVNESIDELHHGDNLSIVELEKHVDVEFISSSLNTTNEIVRFAKRAGVQFSYLNYTNKMPKNSEDVDMEVVGTRTQVRRRNYSNKEDIWFSNISDFANFQNGEEIKTQSYGVKMNLEALYTILDLLQKNNYSYTTVTSSDIFEKAKGEYVLEQFVDEVAEVEVDMSGNGKVIPAVEDATVEAMINELCELLK